jgi:hypothetical protein
LEVGHKQPSRDSELSPLLSYNEIIPHNSSRSHGRNYHSHERITSPSCLHGKGDQVRNMDFSCSPANREIHLYTHWNTERGCFLNKIFK